MESLSLLAHSSDPGGGLRCTVGWLDRLLRRVGRDREGDVSDAAQGNGDQPTDFDPIVEQAVERALRRDKELSKHEAGSDYGRICRPLLLGPQKYRNPDMWGPDYLLRGAAPGTVNSPEVIAEMRKVPLAEDERYQRASRLRDAIDARLGLPGAGSEQRR